jgi:hypothetical protein
MPRAAVGRAVDVCASTMRGVPVLGVGSLRSTCLVGSACWWVMAHRWRQSRRLNLASVGFLPQAGLTLARPLAETQSFFFFASTPHIDSLIVISRSR